MKADSVLATIGDTPHIRLARMFPDREVWVKSERANPGGSIKDRIALAMIEDAEAARAHELAAQIEGGWIPQQFDNPANVAVHARTTAQEILADFADAPIDAIITGVGTGGHITACAEVLKRSWPNLKVFAVEPSLSPVISGGQPGPHPIQGLGAGFIPGNLHTQALDGAIKVDAEDAREMARRSAREEGLLVGISSGAALAAVAQKLPELAPDARVLAFNYDTGERYLSVPDFLPE
jgi:cysteine synthase A